MINHTVQGSWYVTKNLPCSDKNKGYIVTNRGLKKEEYYFLTKEWADYCAEHFNRLERAVSPSLTISSSDIITGKVNQNIFDPHIISHNGTSVWAVKHGNMLIDQPSHVKPPNRLARFLLKKLMSIEWVKKV